jgi:hypothetical protein
LGVEEETETGAIVLQLLQSLEKPPYGRLLVRRRAREYQK